MTTVTYDKSTYSMDVKGHADYARAGRDIVCAACSALSIALISRSQDVEGYNAMIYTNAEQAIISVSCFPVKECASRCREMLDTIASGFAAISEQYPENLKIIVKE